MITKQFTKQFDHLMNEIVTQAAVFPPFKEGTLPPYQLKTDYAGWDTGSEQTIITPEIAEALELKSLGKEPLNGLGGIREADVYQIALGLPNGFMFHNLKVCSLPIDEYDVLIGMDVISKCDFAITNQGDKTTFSFQTPSTTTIDFKK